MPVLIVYCTCPNLASAGTIAQTLVNERLAACVSQFPAVRSTYRWNEAVEQADEVVLMIKTARERLPALTERLRALHPYELPEILAVEAAGGLPPYLDWVIEQSGEHA